MAVRCPDCREITIHERGEAGQSPRRFRCASCGWEGGEDALAEGLTDPAGGA